MEKNLPPPSEVVGELRTALERAAGLLAAIESQEESTAPTAPPPAPEADARVRELQDRLHATEADLSELSTRLVDTENQRGRLMNLYVATYQLHATLDIEEVTSTIAEIARELLGAERFALLLRAEEEGESVCEVPMASGPDVRDSLVGPEGRYGGGDPAIDATLADGLLRMEQVPGSDAVAVVPLTVQGAVVGTLVLLKLLDHKPALTPEDKDLLDLLAAHAASALLAARVYSTTDRRLKTLESLVKLVR